MRILQLIDTLDSGGAERMAVNYANALVSKIELSALVVTRKEGSLMAQLNDKVSYFFLHKKSTLDFNAVLKLRQIIKQEKIDFIHAHGTSFFTAFLVKIIYPKIKLIFHEHYGNRAFQKSYKNFVLLFCAKFFHKIIVVNQELHIWFQNNGLRNSILIPNFVVQHSTEDITFLKGLHNKRIIHIANFKEIKNHFFLLNIAKKIKDEFPNWTFHLVGKSFNDNYYSSILSVINDLKLTNTVFVYDSVNDIEHVLSQANIGVLTSKSEGLPLVLLEYGLASLPVVVTNVGDIGNIIVDGENGYIVNANSEIDFYDKLRKLMLDSTMQNQFGEKLHYEIAENYTEKAVLDKYFEFLTNVFTS